MIKYGMPYKGSKNGIAEDIINILPSGKRLVDLFGGGGAISHCAVLSGKWETVYYNEIIPMVAETFRKAVNGEYANEKRWISREDFFRLKGTDGYTAICFSFGNNMKDYAYAVELEPWKKALHYARVFGDLSLFREMGIDTDGSRADIKAHQDEYRVKYSEWVKHNISSNKRLYELQHIEALERLENLERLQITCNSYRSYQHKSGDVVYCDIPYEATNAGSYSGFDSKAFYDWADSRDYPVYFSSYDISDDRFIPIWQKEKRTMGRMMVKADKLYIQKRYKEMI